MIAATIPSMRSVLFFLLGFRFPAASISTATFDAIQPRTAFLLIQKLRTAETLYQARLIWRMAMQLDKIACNTEAIKRDVAVTAKAARKKIEPDAFYSYE